MSKQFVSKKNIISINEFMENYIGKKYDGNEKLTHYNMRSYLSQKHIATPERIHFDQITKSDILHGNCIFVKDESHQILAYRNPQRATISSLMDELNAMKKSIATNRKKVMNELGYIEAYGEVMSRDEYMEIQEENSLDVTNKVNRQKYICKRKY